MHKTNRFTTIEFTVIIGVIVFVTILVFSVRFFIVGQNRAKIPANDAECQSNLKQWGLVFSMYTEDNNGYFPTGHGVHDARAQWIIGVLPYIEAQTNLLCCPKAKKRRPDGYEWGGSFNTYYMTIFGKEVPKEASYGANSWIYNPPPDVDVLQGRPTEWNWRTPNVEGAAQIPLFADSMWRGGGPYPNGVRGEPPPQDSKWVRYDREMMHFCINRHNEAVNQLFMDYSVRKVGLKELWTLKWHRQFDINGPWTKAGGVKPEDWPGWMNTFKDY